MHAPTNAMPCSLVYGHETVLPLEIQLPSLHTILALEMTTENNHKLHCQESHALDEKRLQSQ